MSAKDGSSDSKPTKNKETSKLRKRNKTAAAQEAALATPTEKSKETSDADKIAALKEINSKLFGALKANRAEAQASAMMKLVSLCMVACFATVGCLFAVVSSGYLNPPLPPPAPVFVETACSWEIHSSQMVPTEDVDDDDTFLREVWAVRTEGALAIDSEYLPEGISARVRVHCERYVSSLHSDAVVEDPTVLPIKDVAVAVTDEPLQRFSGGAFAENDHTRVRYASCTYELAFAGSLERSPLPGLVNLSQTVYCAVGE